MYLLVQVQDGASSIVIIGDSDTQPDDPSVVGAVIDIKAAAQRVKAKVIVAALPLRTVGGVLADFNTLSKGA